jgi:glycosyltransferase involved in cell wall biosynthesis
VRVQFISPAAQLGGAERCLLDCIAALREKNPHWQIGLLALARGQLLEQAAALGAIVQVFEPPTELAQIGESGSTSPALGSLYNILSSVPQAVRFLGRLRTAIADARPDVIHSNGMKAHLLASLLTPRRTRLVIHLHDFIGARRASRHLLPQLARLRRRAVFIANSHAVAEDFARLAPEADVRTVYNLIDTDYFCPGVAEPGWLADCADLEPPKETATTFGLVATYARWKGHGLFIEAAGLLQAAYPGVPFRFYVVGGPIYATLGSQVQASELREQARTAQIASSFGLVPFQDHVPRVYRSLDVVVHASTQPEPFGRTIVEAMACGRSVIVSRAGGAAELFRDEENALGYQPGNAVALAETMARALDSDKRSRLGRCARAHVLADFSRSKLASELDHVYTDDRHRARRAAGQC